MESDLAWGPACARATIHIQCDQSADAKRQCEGREVLAIIGGFNDTG
jgi:hypothetical protein